MSKNKVLDEFTQFTNKSKLIYAISPEFKEAYYHN